MDSLEAALIEQEKTVEAVLKTAGGLVSALKSWKKAASEGNLAERQKQAVKSADLASSLAEPVKAAGDSWSFDVRTYLGSDQWQNEIQAAAQQADHRLFLEGSDLISSPIVVTSDPARGVIRLGKQRWTKLRPSIVVNELKRLRERGEKDKRILDFLDKLYEASKYLDNNPRPDGAVKAKLRDIYELFCIAPGWKRENSESAFAQDLYALHRSEVRVSRGNKKYEFEFPSGQPKSRDIFDVIDETGRPLRYYMIHFR